MADAPLLKLNDLCVSAADATTSENPLLCELSLSVLPGETHLLVGEAGAGKSVLAKTMLGSTRYVVDSGAIRFRGDDITGWPTDVRAKAGLFLGSPGDAALEGVTVLGLLQATARSQIGETPGYSELHQQLSSTVEALGLSPTLLRCDVSSLTAPEMAIAIEVLQLLIASPKLAIIDLPEAAVTKKSMEVLAAGLARSRVERPGIGTLIMSRYDRLLEDLKPDNFHVLGSGRITPSADSDLSADGTTEGYESLT